MIMFNIRYTEMRRVKGAKCAISKLMYGLSVCTDDNRSVKLVAYRLVHTDEPYSNLHLYHASPSTFYLCYSLISTIRCLFKGRGFKMYSIFLFSRLGTRYSYNKVNLFKGFLHWLVSHL